MSKQARGVARPNFGRMDSPKLDMSEMFAASVATDTEVQTARKISIDLLLDNPYQPRLLMQEEALNELTQVIERQGFQGVLVARPHSTVEGYYELTAGHRRREAARRAGLETLPVVVRDLTDEEMVTLTITENIQREDLSPLEEGKIYRLMADEMNYTHERIAREVGKKRGYVENRIRVARAPEDIQEMVQARPDTLVVAYYLGKVEDKEERGGIIRQVLSGNLATSDIPHYIDTRKGSYEVDSTGTSGDLASISTTTINIDSTLPVAESEPVAASALTPEQRATQGEAASQQRGTGNFQGAKAPSENAGPKAEAAADMQAKAAVEHKAARARLAKLASAISALRTYEGQTAALQVVSAQECTSLAQTLALARELCERFCIGG